MTPERFAELAAQGYNRIPVTQEILADLDTPLSTYLKLADEPWTFLLESVQGGEKWGRYSIIGLPCYERIEVHGFTVQHYKDGQLSGASDVEDPLAWIDQFRKTFKVPEPENSALFGGGLVGYFGFETVRYIEPKLRGISKPDPIGVPDILLLVSQEALIFDNLSGRISILTHADPSEPNALARAQQRIEQLANELRERTVSLRSPGSGRNIDENDFTGSFTEQGYKDAVETIKKYVVSGDLMQCVPSQRMSLGFKATPLDLYRALRTLNPSPYMYFFNLGDHYVVGSSPEILARLEEGEVTVRPIAGTRKRGRNAEEDKALEEDLLSDPKERAEHVMLIDLGRNDVGRICVEGTVKLTDKMTIERYSHVMHIVSNVTGQLRPDLGPIDVLRATFPAGTVSGAAKVRALEVIDEIEPVKRSIYSGAVGYISWQGNMDTAIAIRTGVIKEGLLHVQAGGGIVADSNPDDEWQETLNKRRALFMAASMAEKGLDNL